MVNEIELLNCVVDAGNAIVRIYDSNEFNVKLKEDNSPLTQADKLSHTILSKYLKKTGIPIISEESEVPDFKERSGYDHFWLIDPLDGTKEFIKKNGEFTVNVALIKNNIPVLGVVYAPILKSLYYGSEKLGAFKISLSKNNDASTIFRDECRINVNPLIDSITVVASRTHSNDETVQFIDTLKLKYNSVNVVSKGSSLKICLIAEGRAQYYPRFGLTMEWDTAAAHAILNAAGGQIIEVNTNRSLMYNKENMLNPYFIAKY